MTEFGAVIVTWYPSESDVAHAISLTERCPHVCIVDNTPESAAWHARVAAAGIHLIGNANSGGLGGGFNRGIDLLAGRGAEVFFILDQDSVLDPGYFTDMLATRPPDARPFLAGPVIHEMSSGVFVLGNNIVTVEEIAARSNDDVVVSDFLVSSGTMITKAAWAAVGRFHEGYFIDYLDWDFCHRAARNDVGIVVNTAVLMRHRIGDLEFRTVLGKQVGVFDYPPARRYYQTRNCVYFTTRHARERGDLLGLNMQVWRNLVSIALFERHKARKLLAMACGVVDGLLGRLGALERTHPWMARRVAPLRRETGRAVPARR
ncbi:hypothetical protein [Nocardia sp. NPDC052566]|uniref:hypothetical protein n=1 Tax=Nocardia sp. NPDC052566 TaxID=3364330 RepID=UPI0037C69CD9